MTEWTKENVIKCWYIFTTLSNFMNIKLMHSVHLPLKEENKNDPGAIHFTI